MRYPLLHRFLLKGYWNWKQGCILRCVFWTDSPRQNPSCSFSSCGLTTVMDVATVVDVLEKIAPLEFAEKWDNVGLLIEPPDKKLVRQIMLTIDLTENVFQDAYANSVDFIVAYHPPIFKPLENLRGDNWKNSIAINCVRHKIAVYSPHTALDTVDGGINDWLLRCFECRAVVPIIQKKIMPKYTHLIHFGYRLSEHKKRLLEFFPNVEIIDSSIEKCNGGVTGTMRANEVDIEALNSMAQTGGFFKIIQVLKEKSSSEFIKCGVGRHALLEIPIQISKAVEGVKNFLNLQNIRISLAKNCTLDSVVQSVAVCAGSGAEVLRGTNADIILTGEMSHHDLLDAAHRGSTVILTEHSNSERHYLSHLADILKEKLPGVTVVLSDYDKDPVMIV